MLSVFLLSVIILVFFLLTVIMLNVILLNVIMMNVILQGVIILNVILLNVIMLSAILQSAVKLLCVLVYLTGAQNWDSGLPKFLLIFNLFKCRIAFAYIFNLINCSNWFLFSQPFYLLTLKGFELVTSRDVLLHFWCCV